MAAFATSLLSNCQKKTGDLKPSPPVDSAIVNALYPVTQSFYDGNQSSYPYRNKLEYDKDNYLVKIDRDSTVFYNIGNNQVDQIVNQYNTNNSGKSVLSGTYTTSYVYTMVGLPNTSVNIYNSAPTQVTYTYFNKNQLTGVTQSTPGGQWQFENNKDGLPVKQISADGVGFNYNFTYDDKGNLKKVEFVHLSGPRANALYERLSVTSLDDKPSPFSSVKGYWPISYPQGYNWDYALAFCKNNPNQTITELYDATKNAFVLYEQDDYSYIYNDKGYPTQITINTTYFTAVTTHYVRTYNYTYK